MRNLTAAGSARLELSSRQPRRSREAEHQDYQFDAMSGIKCNAAPIQSYSNLLKCFGAAAAAQTAALLGYIRVYHLLLYYSPQVLKRERERGDARRQVCIQRCDKCRRLARRRCGI